MLWTINRTLPSYVTINKVKVHSKRSLSMLNQKCFFFVTQKLHNQSRSKQAHLFSVAYVKSDQSHRFVRYLLKGRKKKPMGEKPYFSGACRPRTAGEREGRRWEGGMGGPDKGRERGPPFIPFRGFFWVKEERGGGGGWACSCLISDSLRARRFLSFSFIFFKVFLFFFPNFESTKEKTDTDTDTHPRSLSLSPCLCPRLCFSL